MAAHYTLVNHDEKQRINLGRVDYTPTGEVSGFSSIAPAALAATLADWVHDWTEIIENYELEKRGLDVSYSDVASTHL